jgi:phosphate transport system substrate-binding protein
MNENLTPTPDRDLPGLVTTTRRHATGRFARKAGAAALGLSLAFTAVACSSSNKSSTSGATTIPANQQLAAATLNGDGSSLQLAFQQAGIAGFTAQQPKVTINYQGNGSGAGKKDLGNQIVEFAGTDSLLKPAEAAAMKGGATLYFPLVAAPVTVSFNEPSIKSLKLSPDTLAGIFSGKVKTWNAPEIATDNPGTTLPSDSIVIVHRAEASGTTSNFTKYLSAAAPTVWTLGHGDTITWPDSQSGQGNGGVAQKISTTKGAIGYVDYSDAVKAKLTFASIKNKAGEFEAPSLAGASKAVAGATIAPDLTYNALNVAGTGVYPITAGTWMLVYVKQTKHNVGEALKSYINYLVTDGQKLAEPSNYAPLPTSLAQQAVTQLDKLQIPAS